MKKLLFLLLFVNYLIADYKENKVTIQLSWFDQFQFAGYYIAKEKGYYKELGLDVQIKPFEFGIDIPEEIAKNNFDFAVGRETLILDRANNKDIVALYALFQSSPLILLSTKNSQINTIKDFKEKRIMTTIDDASEVSIKSMITSEKLNISDLNFLKHTHNINDLINKKTDVISAYTSKSPYHLQKMGIEFNTFAPKDYGFDMYSDLLYTSEKLIEKDLDKVLKFKKASLKGWKYAYNNIEETVELIINKYNSQKLTKEELIFEGKELKKLSYYKTQNLGEIKLSKLQRIHDLYNVMGLIPNKININDFIFNEKNLTNYLTKEEKDFISKNSSLIVGVERNKKPFSYTDEIGLHKGIVNDYFKIISQKTGLTFSYKINTEDGILEDFEENRIDILASSIHFNLKDSYESPSYFQFNERFFKLKSNNSSKIRRIGTLNYFEKDKKEKLINKFYPRSNTLEFKNVKSAIKALENKYIDVLFISEELMLSHIKDNHMTNIELTNDNKSNMQSLSMITHNNSKVLNSILTKAINHISNEQSIAIHNKWVPLMFEKKINWTKVVLITLVLLLTALLIVYKQISLHIVTKKLKKSENSLIKVNSELKELSEKDHLTKLYNRRYFDNIVYEILLLAKRENKPTSILIFDIDDFKKINDTYGHKVGDYVLVNLAKIIQENSRRSDVIARIGGEEFVILLPNTTLEGAEIYSETLRKIIENNSIKINDLELKITVSMGLTLFKENEELHDTLHKADDSLYQSKRNGKNQLRINYN